MAMSYIKIYHDSIEAVNTLSPSEAGRLFVALLKYGATGEMVTLDGKESGIFWMMKAQIDRDTAEYIKKVEYGKKGGRPEKTKSESLQKKPIGYGKKPIGKQEKEKEKEKEKEEEDIIPPLSPLGGKNPILALPHDIRGVVSEWVAYKVEKREAYKPAGIGALITIVQKKVKEYGVDAVSDVIRQSMSANYKGIIWDALNGGGKHCKRLREQEYSQREYGDEYDQLDQLVPEMFN